MNRPPLILISLLFFSLKNLRGHTGDLEKQVNTLKRQLESETLLRIDLENKNKTLREELQFNQQVHDTVTNRHFSSYLFLFNISGY